MAGSGEKSGENPRAQRLSKALRDNLRRRKDQARKRAVKPAQGGSDHDQNVPSDQTKG